MPGTPGAPYTEAATGYDTGNRSTGTSITLPGAAGDLAATYTTSATYALDGTVTSRTDPAEGGLGAETLKYTYDSLDDLTTLRRSCTLVDPELTVSVATRVWLVAVHCSPTRPPGSPRLSGFTPAGPRWRGRDV